MRRYAWIFLAAIVLPSLALGWLAVHSVRDQQVILEHQQAIISQSITDDLVQAIQQQIEAARHEFVSTTQQWLDEGVSPQVLAGEFNGRIGERWPLAEIGFAVDQAGTIYSPRSSQGIRAKQFRDENDRFLSNRENVEVYSSNATVAPQSKAAFALNTNNQQLERERSKDQVGQEVNAPASPAPTFDAQAAVSTTAQASQTPVTAAPAAPAPAATEQAVTRSASSSSGASKETSSDFQSKNLWPMSKTSRRVSPQQNIAADTEVLSQIMPEESDFRRITATQTSGMLARFLDNKLRLLVWYRPASAPTMIFGAQLNQSKLIDYLKPTLTAPVNRQESYSRSAGADYCLAILNDTGQPVAQSVSGFKGDWKHPFVSTEIGEVLPHWEVALYWLDSQQMSRSARALQWTLGLIVLLLLVAIVIGGYLIALDVRRQTLLAQQKTDFVSNVSHELKTPLTSIRMFADLLAEKRVQGEEKQQSYLRIIAAESARLTRLINNVLDFARMERGVEPGKPLPCDLVEIVYEVTETCRPHLEANGIAFQLEITVGSLPVLGHRDSLAQIVLNLLSNAEKYGGNDILVRVRREETAANHCGCVDVLDRGAGISPSKVKAIFEPFQRLEDSLASGISGSGLGLTLARRLARQHKGDILYAAREGGGSCFTLSIPLTTESKKA